MDMERTILATFPKQIHLGGPSANPFWNVPRALKSLCGEIEAARILIQAHEPLLHRRLSGAGEALFELGIASTCVVITSIIAEKAIKTLAAQTKPEERPWGGKKRGGGDGHNLSGLFRQRLDDTDRAAVRHRLENLPDFWSQYARTDTVEEILDTASDNFVNWRYAMETAREVTGGIPKPLLKVAVALTLVGVDRLNQWQVSGG